VATHQDRNRFMAEQQFGEDRRYRLNVLQHALAFRSKLEVTLEATGACRGRVMIRSRTSLIPGSPRCWCLCARAVFIVECGRGLR
jgi:hypothetical protein